MAYDFIRYANQGATRNQPVSDQLASSLSFLPDLGVTAEVFSGGQAPKGSGGPRTGSTRHDHGNAADVRFYQGGRQLDWQNPDDLPIFTEIVRRGKEAGLTGFGAGPGYMSQGTMHVGFGSPGVWGAGGKSANAPEWLRTAYGEASDVGTGGTGQTMAYGGARDDTLGVEPIAPPTNPGGLGGLGGFQGFVNNPEFGDTLQAIGLSLMSSPSNNPFAGVADNLANRQNLRARQQDRQEARAERQQDRQAIEALLRSQGFNADEARAYSGNASAANAAITQRREVGEENTTRQWLAKNHPDLADAPIDVAVRIAQERRNAEFGGGMTADMRNYRLAQDDPNFASFIGAGSKAAGFRNATPEEAASYGAAAGQFGPDNRFYPINAPSGMSVESDGKGGIRVVQGAVGGKGGAFTEGQSKDNVYSVRARGSLPTLDTYADNLADFGQKVVEADPTGVIRGNVQTPEYQVARTAADEFLQAILRKDTGAAITAQEQELYGRTYLPQPGDSTEVRAYKTKARQRAIAAVEAGMSPAQMVAQERGIAASGGSAPSPVPGTDVGTNNTADPLGLR